MHFNEGAGSGLIIKSASAFKIVYMKMKLEEMDRPFMSVTRDGHIKQFFFVLPSIKVAYGLVYVNLLIRLPCRVN